MIPTIPHDKAQHFVYGATAACAAYLAAAGALGAAWAGPLALLAALALGVAKEARDWWLNRRDGGTRGVELADALWTGAGGLGPFLPWLLS